MKDEVKEKTMELLDLLDDQEDIEATRYEILEYTRGDPTVRPGSATGSEIQITCYYSSPYDSDEDEDSSRFRVK